MSLNASSYLKFVKIVDNLLRFVGQKPEENETTHSKNYRHHY